MLKGIFTGFENISSRRRDLALVLRSKTKTTNKKKFYEISLSWNVLLIRSIPTICNITLHGIILFKPSINLFCWQIEYFNTA